MKALPTLRTPSVNDVEQKTVLVRVDYNVPLEKSGSGWQVADDKRIAQSIETIRFLIKAKAKIVLISHLGRPKSSADTHLSLKPIAKVLANKYQVPCTFIPEIIGDQTKQAVTNLQPGKVLLLENVRFDPREKKSDQQFAKSLAEFGQVYINEAFSSLHRKHTSTYYLPQLLPSFAGFDLKREVEMLTKLLANPRRPFVCLIGGAKIADKVEAIKALANKADIVLIGGGIANTFMRAEGLEIFRSFTEEAVSAQSGKQQDFTQLAGQLIAEHKHERMLKDGYIPLPKIIYPTDVVSAPSISESDHKQCHVLDLTHDMLDKPEHKQLVYADIGPKTTRLYTDLLSQAETIFWNGPMGVWENPLFESGTHKLACAIADAAATSIVGGGDTIAAIDHFGLSKSYSYISTGGGASLELLSGATLPGLEALTP